MCLSQMYFTSLTVNHAKKTKIEKNENICVRFLINSSNSSYKSICIENVMIF